jgi:transposase-like protein
MGSGKPANVCHRCGATNYRPVIARAEDGVMRPSGQYRCQGCKFVFSTVDEWRFGPALGQGVKS